jgi:putative transposase
VRQTLSVSERRVCHTLGQHCSTQRKVPCGLPDEAQPTEEIIALAEEFGCYGYRRITGVLNKSGWHVNHQRVERIWRREGARRPSIATEEETDLAERRFVRRATAGAPELCLVL